MLYPVLSIVTRECDNGISLLGEIKKFTTLSEQRFKSIECTEEGLIFELTGAAQEEIEVWYATKDGTTRRIDIIMPNEKIALKIEINGFGHQFI